ncbi:MAG: outer membrane protein transport protein [Myxococcota bacterium]|nr:outer membrane protein transport protein [Myxococcota bacterium]
MSSFLFAMPALVQAGGLDFPEQGARSLARGGAFSARADDPTAAIHNPGALSKQRGYRLMVSYNLIWEFTEYTPGESHLDIGELNANPNESDPMKAQLDRIAAKRSETVSNTQNPFPYGVTLGATADFGLKNWTFAFSLYGPNSNGHKIYDPEGGQRYMLQELDTLAIYYGLSAAYGTTTFGIGATLQWVQLPILDFSLAIDANPDLLSDGNLAPLGLSSPPYSSYFDIDASIRLHDHFAPSAILGAWWRPIPSIELALSGRVVPVKFNAEGEVDIKATVPDGIVDQIDIQVNGAQLDVTLPPTGRFGVRYRHLSGQREIFDIELNVVFEAWSSLDRYDVKLDAEPIEFSADRVYELERVTIEKNWHDTWSVRLGGTWNVMPDQLDVSLGGFWEQGAAPDAYYHLDFPSSDRIGVGSGVTVALGRDSGLSLTLAYLIVLLDDVQLDANDARVYQQRPLRPCTPEAPCTYTNANGQQSTSVNPAANAGTYTSTFHQLGVAIQADF